MNTPIKTALSVALATLSFNLFAADFYKEFNVNAVETLDLRTDSGSIEVRTHNSDTVIVDVEVTGDRAEDFDVRAELQGDKVVVVGELEGRSFWNSLRVEFNIVVPETFDVNLRTSGGSIEVDDLTGDIDADTSGGSIAVGNVHGNVQLNTSGGSIKTSDIYGEIDAHTSGGSIKVNFAKQPIKDASLTTSGGSITAYLPDDIAVDLDASTSGGRVRSDFDVNGRVKKQSIRGEINGGGPKLKLRTSGGSVTVKQN